MMSQNLASLSSLSGGTTGLQAGLLQRPAVKENVGGPSRWSDPSVAQRRVGLDQLLQVHSYWLV